MALALMQSFFPLAGAFRRDYRWMSVARPAAWGQFAFLLLAFFSLAYGFTTNDFTVKYVANHSNSFLPVWYKVSAVWGGHEGSLLLWVLILSGWTSAVAMFSRNLPSDMAARVIGVMGLISVGFLSFLLFTSNPFERLLPDFPMDGADLNPLLQDVGLIFHPPILYMGYVGFSVAFAFAVAGLMGGKLDSAWARWSRPWTILAWCFLTLGIALGSWWAYYELGWGGWWFWDPVENASFMPWLTGTALMHSLIVTEKRGVFKAWTALLAILAFSLSLLGTFLVRSGVLTSVHAFATDPARGLYILIFLFVVVGGSLLLFAARAHALSSESRYRLFSREMFLLINNVLLVTATGVVLAGTLSPIVFDVLGLGQISVGPPYFNIQFVPIALLVMVFAGVGPLVTWKKHNPRQLFSTLTKAVVISGLVGVVVSLLMSDAFYWSVVMATGSAMWVILLTGTGLWLKVRAARQGIWRGFLRLPRSYQGMVLAHTGLAVTIVGVTMVSMYDVEMDVRMAVGDQVMVGDYAFRFEAMNDLQGPNYSGSQATILIMKNEKIVTSLLPEKRRYWVQRNTMTEAAIDPGFTRDLYVALGEEFEDGSWALRVYYKPFVRWMWGGAMLMALGGFIAISDRRYRMRVRNRVGSMLPMTGVQHS